MTTPVADARTTCEVGRSARLELRFAVRNGVTVLAHEYAEPPFRVGRAFRCGSGLHLILTSSSPGIFGGDSLSQDVRVEPGAHVRLTSQSALQIHPSSDNVGVPRVARLQSTYTVGEGATLECEWHPIIPFARSRFEQRIQIALEKTARLCWSDAFMAGRDASGERWQFASLSHELRCVRGGALDYLERYFLEPEAHQVAQPWIASDARYFGTILLTGDAVDSVAAERLHRDLQDLEIRGAVDTPAERLLLVRLMSREGARFHAAREFIGSRLKA